ncbi:MAG: 30S ribosomal protein S8 [Candidatus Peribacteraceae bacterium]|nr:30S ribosomal protein S8 [Candidatus Peribacteria bacterium]
MASLSDPIGDFLTRLRNAQHARRHMCTAPWSRMKEQLCGILQKEKLIASFAAEGEGVEKVLVVQLHPAKKLELQRVSKPGRRVYTGYQDIKPVLRGFGIAILTTSQGLMTDRDARKQHLGGEILCTIA